LAVLLLWLNHFSLVMSYQVQIFRIVRKKPTISPLVSLLFLSISNLKK
jgi:hypothetical protein